MTVFVHRILHRPLDPFVRPIRQPRDVRKVCVPPGAHIGRSSIRVPFQCHLSVLIINSLTVMTRCVFCCHHGRRHRRWTVGKVRIIRMPFPLRETTVGKLKSDRSRPCCLDEGPCPFDGGRGFDKIHLNHTIIQEKWPYSFSCHRAW